MRRGMIIWAMLRWEYACVAGYDVLVSVGWLWLS